MPTQACGLCGAMDKRFKAILDGAPVCESCYYGVYRPGTCAQCGKGTRLHPSQRDTSLCASCRRKARCVRCGKGTWKTSVNAAGEPVCTYCRRFYEPKRVCPRCGNASHHFSRCLRLGIDEPVCSRCQIADYEGCSVCGKHRRVASRTSEGKPVCPRCTTQPVFLCPACGKEGKRHSMARCAACYYRDATTQKAAVLAGSLTPAWLRPIWLGFVTHLLGVTPATGKLARRLEFHFQFFQAVGKVCRTPMQLTAERLFAHFGRDGLRQASVPYGYLAQAGHMPALADSTREALTEDAVQARMLAAVTVPWQRALLERYQQHLNAVSQAYRRKGWSGEHERFTARTVTLLLRAGAKFLDSLAEEVDCVQAIDQDAVYRFVAVKPGHHSTMLTFIRYLNRFENLFTRLRLQAVKASGVSPKRLLSPERADALTKSWLAPRTNKEVRNGLLGMLMLRYARTIRQAVALRRDDFQLGADGLVYVNFGTLATPLDEEVTQLFRCHLANREAENSGPLDGNDYLFPGRGVGRHLSPDAATYMLRKVNVHADELFSTAVAGFYRNGLKRPNVLVKTLGISRPTANAYWQLFAPRVSEELAQRHGRR